eukprot:3726497-Pyramimonas_sp.AAC.1
MWWAAGFAFSPGRRPLGLPADVMSTCEGAVVGVVAVALQPHIPLVQQVPGQQLFVPALRWASALASASLAMKRAPIGTV